jgi:tetratricopeptide (TPR) repeat protein
LIDLSRSWLLTVHDGESGKEYGQHAMVQAFYYSLLGKRERQAMHRRAGEYYETDEPDALKAARHFERAGDYERAARLATADVWGIINRGQARGLRLLLEQFTSGQLEPSSWAAVNIARGQADALLGESQLARAAYEEALSQLATFPNSPQVRELKGRAYHGMGELLQQESPPEALDWLRRGLAELAGANTLDEAALHVRVGIVHINMGDLAAALTALEQGLRLLSEGPSQLRAIALLNFGVVYCLQGDIERGKAYYLRALEISQQLHDYWRTVDIGMNLGIEIDIAGDWAAATVEYQKALALAERLGSPKKQAELELALGIVKTKQGNDEAAQAHLSTCLAIANDHNFKTHLVAAESSLADLHIRQGDTSAAEPRLAHAERLALEMDANHQLPEIYRGWALVELAKKQPQAALDYAERSVNLARDLGLGLEEGMSLRVLGQVQCALSGHDTAQTSFELSIALLANRDPYEAARTKAEWGACLLLDGEVERGKALLQEARTLFEQLGAQRDRQTCARVLND